MDKQKARNALTSISRESDAKPLWEIFPAYALSLDFNASPELVATLEESYAPEAVRLRSMFLQMAEWRTEETAKRGDPVMPASIADDLFKEAGAAFEAHLRTRSIRELSLFRQAGVTIVRVLSTLFKPRDKFNDEEWATMRAALSAVWQWAARWHLDHYIFVHYAFVALLDGHRYIINETGMLFNLDYDRRRDVDFVYAREPGLGWDLAWKAFYLSATAVLNDAVDAAIPPPKGFPPYRGASSRSDVADRDKAQDNYVAGCKRQAKDIIENIFSSEDLWMYYPARPGIT